MRTCAHLIQLSVSIYLFLFRAGSIPSFPVCHYTWFISHLQAFTTLLAISVFSAAWATAAQCTLRRAGRGQHAAAFLHGAAGGDHIIHHQNAPSRDGRILAQAVCSQHIGPALFRQVQPRLLLGIAHFFQQLFAGQVQPLCQGLATSSDWSKPRSFWLRRLRGTQVTTSSAGNSLRT